jgi:coenzyme F420-reducing hydrogenase delta subunit
MDQKSAGLHIAIFFCQQVDEKQDVNRRALEKELGPQIRFFPLPCSGRIDPLHFLKALESGADMVYLVRCPEGACRYREGNLRAKKRIAFAKGLLAEIGLEPERLELVSMTTESGTTIDDLAKEFLSREAVVSFSPLRVRDEVRTA